MVLVLRVHGISLYVSEVYGSVAMVVMWLLVVQLCVLVVDVEHLKWLMVEMVHMLVVSLLVLVEMVWIGKLYCWSYEPSVPGVSCCRAGMNLIVSRGFLCGCSNDFAFCQIGWPRV